MGNSIFSSQSNRVLKSTWPKDNALFDMKSTYSSNNLDRDLQGTIDMQMPLASRHVTAIAYNLKNQATRTTGNCVVKYQGNQVLEGRYNSKTESRDGIDRDIVDITLQNRRLPLGILYSHEQSGDDANQYVNSFEIGIR